MTDVVRMIEDIEAQIAQAVKLLEEERAQLTDRLTEIDSMLSRVKRTAVNPARIKGGAYDSILRVLERHAPGYNIEGIHRAAFELVGREWALPTIYGVLSRLRYEGKAVCSDGVWKGVQP